MAAAVQFERLDPLTLTSTLRSGCKHEINFLPRVLLQESPDTGSDFPRPSVWILSAGMPLFIR